MTDQRYGLTRLHPCSTGEIDRYNIWIILLAYTPDVPAPAGIGLLEVPVQCRNSSTGCLAVLAGVMHFAPMYKGNLASKSPFFSVVQVVTGAGASRTHSRPNRSKRMVL